MRSRPSWLDLAYGQVGITEIPGPKADERILDYHNETSLKATSDEVPWCSAFMCAMFEWAGIPSTRSAMARSWLDWGVQLDAPRMGCVVVLWRGNKDGPSGHCGFYVGETDKSVQLLGGNQNNKVCVRGYSKDRILGYRWPQKEVELGDLAKRDYKLN